jgi:hypothetical protein
MVTPMLKKHFEDNSVEIIPLLGGARLVAELFLDYQALSQVLVGNWMQLPKKTFSDVAKGSQDLTRRLVKPVRLLENRFLLGHQIQKGRVTLPVSAVVSICKQVCLDVAPEGFAFQGCDSVKLFQGLHLDVSDTSKQDLALHIQCQPSSNGSIGSYVVSIREGSNKGRACYQATCRMSGSSLSGEAPTVIVDTNGQVVADRTAVYQQIFHTEHFRTIHSVFRCDATGIAFSCSSVEGPGESDLSLNFEPQSALNRRETIDFDAVGQAMVLWAKLHLQKSSLPTEYFNIKLFDQELEKSSYSGGGLTSTFDAVMTVLNNAGNGLITGRVEAFNATSRKCLFKMDATIALSGKDIY